MKNTFTAFLGLLFLGSISLAKPLPKTDTEKVYGSGVDSAVPGPAFSLKPGVYKLGDDSHKLNGTHFLMVDTYVNDDSRFLAVLVKQSSVRGQETGTGRFYLGKKIKNGSSLMLSPIFIDINGNVAVEAELNEKAPVIEITLRNGASDFRYPYILQGYNGALDGQLMGMRATNGEKIKFTSWPAKNVFEGYCSDSKLLVTGSTVAVHTNSRNQERFELLPLNGDGGKFAAMVTSDLNTMGEYITSESNVSKLAFFINDTTGEENFIIATPTFNVGEYKFQYYGRQRRGFFDRFFPGKQD